MNTKTIFSNESTIPKIEHWNTSDFYKQVHSHNECQITFIQEGSGLLFVSNKVVRFEEGDLYFFGANVPHALKSSNTKSTNHKKSLFSATTLFFDKDIIKNSLSSIPEASRIIRFIDFAENGVKLSKSLIKNPSRIIHQMAKKNGVEKLFLFMHFLDVVSKDNNSIALCTKSASKVTGVYDGQRIQKVYEFIKKNHKDQITLKQVAYIANMSPTGFCRFFKKKSEKTFSRYLTEARIGSACELLHGDRYDISECGYYCGYNSMSNFHKHFKKIIGMSPSEYRRNYRN